MNSRLPVWLLLAAALAPLLGGAERNGWPVVTEREESTPAGTVTTTEMLGPLFYQRQNAAGGQVEAFRPLMLWNAQGEKETTHLLYPLFTWQRDGAQTYFSFFELINDRRTAPQGGAAASRHFDVWPFYFSRQTGNPAEDYRALFPVAGTIKNRFGDDRLTWCVFPLYLHTEKSGKQVTSVPWPFIRIIEGAGHHGFEFWPVFGERGRPGDYHNQFLLWPLLYKNETNLSAAQPDVKLGALPFYTRETGPGYRSENYVWPLFGYTHRTEPTRYDETRYLWPVLVQGRGEDKYINRWAPLYTHSVIKGYDKTWLAWPVFRQARWSEQGVAQEKNQFLYFVYWSLEQRSLANPAAAPAYKKHLWPLFSAWDNGAGRRQLQLLSPLEVFFPQNDVVRQLYSPLFAVYRYDQRTPDDVRWSVLWGLLSRHDSPAEKEFHLGPLFSTYTAPDRARVAFGHGLLGWRREPGAPRWRFFLFDFRTPSATKAPAASTQP